MTVHKALHPRDDVDRLYVSRKEVGRGHIETTKIGKKTQLYDRFKRLMNTISHDKTRDGLRKGNLMREMKSLQIAAQENAIRTNHIKAWIDKTKLQDETINHIISVCSKLARKEYKTTHGWVYKVIYWEMCQKFKFDHTNKW